MFLPILLIISFARRVNDDVWIYERLELHYCECEAIPRPSNELLDFSEDAIMVLNFVESSHPMFTIDGWVSNTYWQAREDYIQTTSELLTITEFALATQRVLATLEDGHISRSFLTPIVWEWDNENEDFNRIDKFFQDGGFVETPFRARPYGIFLADEYNRLTDYRVISIGGVAIENITAQVDRYFGAYNNPGRLRNHARYSGYELMLTRAGADIFFINETQCPTVIIELENNGNYFRREILFTKTHPSNDRINPTPPFLQYQFLENEDVFYIWFGSLHYCPHNHRTILQSINRAMREGVRDFIFDLRDSPGGNPAYVNQLLEALGLAIPSHGKILRLNESNRYNNFLYFDGISFPYFAHLYYIEGQDIYAIPSNLYNSNPYDVFVVALTSERTFSGGTIAALTIGDSDFGIIIGEPSAGGANGIGWGTTFSPPTARLLIRSHITMYFRPDQSRDPLVVEPDIFSNDWEALDVAIDFLRTRRNTNEEVA